MTKNLNVKIKQETFDALCVIAESNEVTLSHLMRQVIKDYLIEIKKKESK